MRIGLDRLAGTFLLPAVCPGCLGRPPAAAGDFCADCAGRLHELPAPRCRSCGGSIDGVLAVCGECLEDGERPWRHAVSVYGYGGFVRELVHRLKYGKAVYLTLPLGAAMAAAWRMHGNGPPEVVTFVPMHWFRQFWRGYNQAELLAGQIGRSLAAPAGRLLKRRRWSRKQVALGRDERKRNLNDAFAVVHPGRIRGRRVLVVDDVFTTGATLEAVTRAIKTCEPAEIRVLTLARG